MAPTRPGGPSRMRTTWVVALLGVAGVLGACAEDPDLFSEQDRALIRAMQLQGTPTGLGNEFANRADVAAFGQKLFFDERLSASGVLPDGGSFQVACVDCHAPSVAFSDPRKTKGSAGVAGATSRNALPLANVGFRRWFAWDGRSDTLWGQVHFAYEADATMAGTPQRLVDAMTQHYADEYAAVFGGHCNLAPVPLECRYDDLLKALGAYLLRLQSANAPIDRYAAGDDTALTEAQKRGLRLFLGEAGCITCHRGPLFTDEQFYALGLPQDGDDPDPGRLLGLQKLAMGGRYTRTMLAGAGTEADRGTFRTASLRNVALTAPYFHAGQAATLKDVVWFYNHGGDHQGPNVSPLLVPLGLTDAQQEDLVEFLGALTGDPVPAALACNNNGDPGSTRGPKCGGGK